MMWEQHRVSYGMLALALAWATAVALVGCSWWLGEPLLGYMGIAAAVIGGTLTVMRDNAHTRRVVRAVARESRLSDPSIRSLS